MPAPTDGPRRKQTQGKPRQKGIEGTDSSGVGGDQDQGGYEGSKVRPCQKAVTASATHSLRIPLLAKTRVQLTGQGPGRLSRANTG